MIEYPNTTIVREQIDPENFIFSGFILSILQKEFLLILSQHGYTVQNIEVKLNNELDWTLKLSVCFNEQNQLILKSQISFNYKMKYRILDVESDTKNFRMSFGFQVDDIPPGKNIFRKLNKIESHLKLFIHNVYKSMIGDVKIAT